MSVAATIFAQGHQGVIFGGKLLDENGLARDLTGFTDLQVIFTKPDGTKITKSTSDGVVPAIPLQLDNTDIEWKNDGVSILDQKGPWRLSVTARFSSDSYIPSYQGIVFWVV